MKTFLVFASVFIGAVLGASVAFSGEKMESDRAGETVGGYVGFICQTPDQTHYFLDNFERQRQMQLAPEGCYVFPPQFMEGVVLHEYLDDEGDHSLIVRFESDGQVGYSWSVLTEPQGEDV